jgi:hypothetical protein
MTDTQGQVLIAALRACGASLALDAEGDLDVGGKPKALAVWHAMDAAINNLGDLVTEALAGGNTSTPPAQAEDPPARADTPERWRDLDRNAGIDTVMHRALGGGEPAAVPVAKATITPSTAQREEYKRAPQVAGIYIATPAFQRWRELWRQAAAQGREQEFLSENPAPYWFPGDA